jgi:hypothetical protein
MIQMYEILINPQSPLNPLQSFTMTETGQFGGCNKAADCIGIDFAVFAQCPANGFADKEFLFV